MYFAIGHARGSQEITRVGQEGNTCKSIYVVRYIDRKENRYILFSNLIIMVGFILRFIIIIGPRCSEKACRSQASRTAAAVATKRIPLAATDHQSTAATRGATTQVSPPKAANKTHQKKTRPPPVKGKEKLASANVMALIVFRVASTAIMTMTVVKVVVVAPVVVVVAVERTELQDEQRQLQKSATSQKLLANGQKESRALVRANDDKSWRVAASSVVLCGAFQHETKEENGTAATETLATLEKCSANGCDDSWWSIMMFLQA